MTWCGRHQKISVAAHVRRSEMIAKRQQPVTGLWRCWWKPEWTGDIFSESDEKLLNCLNQESEMLWFIWSLYKECVVARARDEAEKWEVLLHWPRRVMMVAWHRTEIVEMMIYWGVESWKMKAELTGVAGEWGRVMLLRWGCFIWK